MRVRSDEISRRVGLTLVEIVMVLAIMGIIFALAVPRYAGAICRFQVDTASRRLIRDLTTARERARAQGANQTVAFTVASDTYEVTGLAGLDGSADYTVDVSDKPYNASITSADFGGESSIVFDGYGVPASGGTIVLESGGYTKTVVVDAETGRSSLQ